MTKFKHKNGGVAEVFTQLNIERLRADKNYVEIHENTPKKVKPKEVKPIEPEIEEVVEDKPLQ